MNLYSWKWRLVYVVLLGATGLVITKVVRTHIQGDDAFGDLHPAIRARILCMEAVDAAAEPICREPTGKARDAHLAALQREHQAFDIECSEDGGVAVRLRPASHEREEVALQGPNP